MSKWEDYIIILAENQEILDDIWVRLGQTLEGSYIHKDGVIPYMIIKSTKNKLDAIRQYLILLEVTDKKFVGKLNFIDRVDLK